MACLSVLRKSSLLEGALTFLGGLSFFMAGAEMARGAISVERRGDITLDI